MKTNDIYDLADLDSVRYPYMSEFYPDVTNLIHLIRIRDYVGAFSVINNNLALCQRLKNDAVAGQDEKTANLSFLLTEYLNLIKSIGKFWQLCDSLDYQDAWFPLQDGIDCLRILRKFMLNPTQLGVNELSLYLENIEKLFPYAVFASIEAIAMKKTCSICKKSPYDSQCEHIAGDLYFGKMATIVVEKLEGLGISMVENPMDKRCIFFMNYDKKNIENSQFRLVHALTKTLKAPLVFFDLELTTRRLPRSYYASWTEDSCPCGSKKKFRDCCYDKEYIDNPHFEIREKKVTLSLF